MFYFLLSGPTPDFFAERRRNHCQSRVFPILDILTHSGDIRDQSLKLWEINVNFACFGPKFLGDGFSDIGTFFISAARFQSCSKVSRRSVEGVCRSRDIMNEYLQNGVF